MKELEQYKNQYNKLVKELENTKSIGIVRSNQIIKELETIKESAEEIIRNPGKYTDNVVALSGETVRFTIDVEGKLDVVRTDNRQMIQEKSDLEAKEGRANEEIYKIQTQITDAMVRAEVLRKQLEEKRREVNELRNKISILADGEPVSVKKTSNKEPKKEESKKEEIKKEDKKDEKKNIKINENDLVIVEHPTWNIPRFWNPYLTEEQYLEALNRGIHDPNGPEYIQYMKELGLDPSKKAIFWHPLLSEEQISDAFQNDIYEPYGPEYNQFLNNLGLSTKYNAVLPNKVSNKFRPAIEEPVEKVEKKDLNKPNEEEKKEEMVVPKKKGFFIPDDDELNDDIHENMNKLSEELEKDLNNIEHENSIPQNPSEFQEDVIPKPAIEESSLDDGYDAILKEPSDTLWRKIKDALISASAWLATLVTTIHANKVSKFISEPVEANEEDNTSSLNRNVEPPKKEEPKKEEISSTNSYIDEADTNIPILDENDIKSLQGDMNDITDLEKSFGL